MAGYLLDTNAFSDLISGQKPKLRSRFQSTPITEIRISALTRGEVEYGLAKTPDAKRLARLAAELFDIVDALPWTSETAQVYGRLRAEMTRRGRVLSPFDMAIAAHALELGAVLITRDRAFSHVPALTVADWSQD